MTINEHNELSSETPPIEDAAASDISAAPAPAETLSAKPVPDEDSLGLPQPSAPEPAKAPAPEHTTEAVVTHAAPTPKPGFWERPGWLALCLAVFFAIILSTALSLGVLAAANGGLRYATPAEVLALQAKLDTLQTRLDTQEQDLNGLRARLEAVEKLAGRTTTLEQAAETLRSELEKRTSDLEKLRDVVGQAQKQIEQVITQSTAFETFISGMRSLLENIPLPGVTKP